MTDFVVKRQQILGKIAAACEKNARKVDTVQLLAVSKPILRVYCARCMQQVSAALVKTIYKKL